MKNQIIYRKIFILFAVCAILSAATSAFGAATIVIQNNDAANVGFNDTTPVAPVGGNPGTTLGAQRLNAFQAAANVWGATLDSVPTVTIKSQWTALSCTATSATLGSAGALQVFRDFSGAPFPGTWYGEALTNRILGSNADPTTAEINANFNVNLGNSGCLTGTHFYLGLDGNHGTDIDLQTVLEHEFAHGLGFQTFTNGSTGAFLSSFPSVYDRFLLDNGTGKSWFSMTAAERSTSALNTGKLAWDGLKVQNDVPNVLGGNPTLKINSPASLAGNYLVGTASFGSALTTAGTTGNVVQALDPSDSAGTSTTDGCSALTNAAAVAGNIAIIDRGTCGFVIKVKNAQNAGAIAVIIADNAAGTPPAGLGGADATITIPAVRVTQADGNLIKAQLGTGVNVSILLDTAIRAGADKFNRALVYTPNPFQSGSSVSHWDTGASPNQLMEPAINSDLTHNVTAPTDLTFSLLSDIGWVASTLPTSLLTTTGGSQSASTGGSFTIPLSVTVSPAIAGVPVTFTAPETGASGTFQSGSFTGLLQAVGVRSVVVNTDSSGVATAPTFTANNQTGSYILNATAPGAGTTGIALNNLAPTAAGATVSGQVLTANGRGLRNAVIILRMQDGTTRSVITGTFGFYRFTDVPAGQTVLISVLSKQFRYQPQLISITENLAGVNFIAVP